MKKYLILLTILLIIPQIYAEQACYETNSNETTLVNTSLEPTINTVTNYTCNCKTEDILPEGYCDISLSLKTDKNNYTNGEKITINNLLSNKSYNFSIDYWVEYENGSILKERLTTTNTNPKQYTPKLSDNTTIIIKNNLTSLGCININNNTQNEVKLFVEVEKDPNPSLIIEKLYLNRSRKINIGENLTALLSAYSGNNTNYVIKTYIENLTNETNHTIFGEFNYTSFNITTAIPYNCNTTTGNYTFVAKTENIEIKQTFNIINNCITNTSNSVNNTVITSYDETTYNKNSSESVINLSTGALTGSTIYESASIKAKKAAVYIFMIILAALTILIITKSKNTQKILEETTEKWSSQLEQ